MYMNFPYPKEFPTLLEMSRASMLGWFLYHNPHYANLQVSHKHSWMCRLYELGIDRWEIRNLKCSYIQLAYLAYINHLENEAKMERIRAMPDEPAPF